MTLRAAVGLSMNSSASVLPITQSAATFAESPSCCCASSSTSSPSVVGGRTAAHRRRTPSLPNSAFLSKSDLLSRSEGRIGDRGRGGRGGRRGFGTRHGVVGTKPGGMSLSSPLQEVRAQRSGAGARKADISLSFPLFSAEDLLHLWPMRSRPNMDSSYKQLPQGRRTITEAERARAASAYLAYEPPESLAANPPWQISFPHVCVATISAVLFGYHLAVVNIPLSAISVSLGFAGDTFAQGMVVSACLVGAFFGSTVSGVIADSYGRRRSFQLSTMPMIVGSILSATAPNLLTMLVGRFFVGAGLGVAGPITALYVSEISPTNVRGTLGSLCQVATCIGILGAILCGLPISTMPNWWRVCFWIAIIPAGILLFAMEFCAESPRWLFKQSQWSEAEYALERLWGPAHAKGAMADLVRSDEEIGDAPWKTLLDVKYRKVVLLGAALFAFQQFAGINAVFYFSSVVFKNAGVSSVVLASVYMGIVNLLASFVAATLMDKQGRRNLMVWSFAGMGISMAVQAAAAGVTFLAPIQGPMSLLATLSYVFMFAIGAGPVPGLLLPEIFTNRIRAKAMSVAMCVHWIVNFTVGLFFLQVLQQLGPATVYTFFSTVCFAAAIFVTRNVTETKGRSLEEINALLLADL